MYVIEVIPLKRGIPTESLSYYSSVTYKQGTLLKVPLRNKETTALVISSKPVSAAKTALKTATFSLRKLPEQKNTAAIPQTLITTCEKVATVVPASIGAILFAILPPDIRDGERVYPHATEQKGTEDTAPRILTDSSANRFIAYRTHIRQTFAHRGSVMFVVPTSAAVEEVRKKLEVGIENRVITFSGAHTKKQLNEAYEAFEDLSQAKLIVVSPSYAFLHRHDLLTTVIESCGSRYYAQRTRPYLDVREVLKMHAKETGRSILLGDCLPQTEDEIKRREEIYSTHDEHTKRLELPGTIMLAQHKKVGDDEKYTLCTSELQETIQRTLLNKGNVFLYAARRGLAPAVTCYDCGYIFRCPDSGAPYSLMRVMRNGEEERYFMSATSGKKVRAADVCERCGSWRLREQGIGIQQVYDQIKKLFPKTEIFLFDHTTASTHAKAKKLITQFYGTKRSILIATSMVFPYLSRPVETSAVMSYEATKVVPTWRSDETTFSLLLNLREVTSKDVVVQLRNEPDELIELAKKGLVDQFYDGEIQIRHALLYPPYATFVLLSYTGTKIETEGIEKTLEEVFKSFEIQFYSAPQSSSQKTLRYGLIRVLSKNWPNSDLLTRLRSLPPYIKIEINPDRIV